MSLFSSLFRKKQLPASSYTDFWLWFQTHEKSFYQVIKNRKNSQEVEKLFFNKIAPKLAEIKDGFFYLTGMYDNNTVELVLTADGTIKNIAFVEDLVAAAPVIEGWKFTALKPALDIKDINIEMRGMKFNNQNIWFYANETTGYPDEIDINITHSDLTEENKDQIFSGIYIYLDNFLGELDFINNIDNLNLVQKSDIHKELIPVEKLKDFLSWRQKEFLEKYEGSTYDTANDTYSIFEAELKNGKPLVATINTDLLNWDTKASHPWISVLTFKYKNQNKNGLPNEIDYGLSAKIEEEIMQELKDIDGYLNIGRQTVNGERELYFACKDFRLPSKVFFKAQQKYSGILPIDIDIYKDKYWKSFERFSKHN